MINYFKLFNIDISTNVNVNVNFSLEFIIDDRKSLGIYISSSVRENISS
jgi:hypothetical protein